MSSDVEDASGPAAALVLDAVSKVTENTTPSTSFSSAASGSVSTSTPATRRDRSQSDATPISPRRRPSRRTRVQSMNEGSVGSHEFFRTSSAGSASVSNSLTRPRRITVSAISHGTTEAQDPFGASVSLGGYGPTSGVMEPSYCKLGSGVLDSTMVSERQDDEGEDEDPAPADADVATENNNQVEQVMAHPSPAEQVASPEHENLTKTTPPPAQDLKPDGKTAVAPTPPGVDARCHCIIL